MFPERWLTFALVIYRGRASRPQKRTRHVQSLSNFLCCPGSICHAGFGHFGCRSEQQFVYGSLPDSGWFRPVLSPYQLRAVPPIHIIVNQGHVTLEGVVSKQMDKQVAELQAKSVAKYFQ